MIGTRDELTSAVESAVRRDEPERLLVVFRVAGFADFAHRFGNKSMEMMAGHIARRVPDSDDRWTSYFRPREDELSALIEGQLARVGQALSAAAATVNEAFGPEGVTLGYSTTLLPSGLGSFIEAIARVDRQIVGPSGEPMRRSYRTDFMTLRGSLRAVA